MRLEKLAQENFVQNNLARVLDKLQQVSEQMLRLAQATRWDELNELQQSRAELMTRIFSGPDSVSLGDRVFFPKLQEIQRIDQSIMAACKKAHGETLGQVQHLRKSRKAAQNYLENTT